MERVKILLFAGTTEGRELAIFLKEQNVNLTIYVATQYGAELLESIKENVFFKRLDQEAIQIILEQEKYDVVVDATHPFATLVTHHIKRACAQTNTAYIRIIRSSREMKNIVRVGSIEEAVNYLKEKDGNILLTTGSKVLEPFTQLPYYKERIYIRLLPIGEHIEKCRLLGFLSSHLIAMQGPFSQEMNESLLSHTQASYLVTKESGTPGGIEEKIQACQKRGVQVIMINKPTEENGYLLEEAEHILNQLIKNNKVMKGRNKG